MIHFCVCAQQNLAKNQYLMASLEINVNIYEYKKNKLALYQPVENMISSHFFLKAASLKNADEYTVCQANHLIPKMLLVKESVRVSMVCRVSSKNVSIVDKCPDTRPKRCIWPLQLIYLLLAEASSEMVSVEGWLSRSHSHGWETGSKEWGMSNDTRTGLKFSSNRSYGGMNQYLNIFVKIFNMYRNGHDEGTFILHVFYLF